MKITAGKFTMTQADIKAVQANVANLTSDPYGSPVFQLRKLIGV